MAEKAIVDRPRHVIAIDPGNEESALVVWDGSTIEVMRYGPNEDIIELLRSWRVGPRIVPLAIEMIASYGMPVGAEVFETCYWSGRFAQAWLSRESRLCVTRGWRAGGLLSHSPVNSVALARSLRSKA